MLFDLPKRGGRTQDNLIAKKSKVATKKAPTTRKGGGGVLDIIANIVKTVDANLGHFKEESLLIQDEQTLIDYIDEAIKNKVIAIDTETTGLDPLTDTLVGICIYTPNKDTAYIPLNHISYITNEHLDNQLDMQFVKEQFERLVDADMERVMFNAVFDVRFLKNQLGVHLKCTCDCSLSSRLLNENEPHKNLKQLHNKYCLGGKGDAFRFDDLFKGVTFDKIPITTGYLYASHDAIITYQLYQFQRPFLTATDKTCIDRELVDVAWVFHHIEMPCVEVVVDMEDNGIEFDFNYANELSDKYNAKKEESLNTFYSILADYSDKIETYKALNPSAKLDDPINIASSSQIAILLYDILKVKEVDKKNPRGTGVDILSQMDLPITKAILDYRGLSKLVDTYIDKLPLCVNSADGRIHCKFNQYGADTGRFSSNNPNLQNIPSHNHDIRKMFKAKSSEDVIESIDNTFEVSKWCSVETPSGFVYADSIKVGDSLLVDTNIEIIVTKINLVDNNHILFNTDYKG